MSDTLNRISVVIVSFTNRRDYINLSAGWDLKRFRKENNIKLKDITEIRYAMLTPEEYEDFHKVTDFQIHHISYKNREIQP